MEFFLVTSGKQKQVIDISDKIDLFLRKNQKYKEGIVVVCIAHTTAALTVADLDPGTDLDYLDAYEAIMPKLNYRHPHDPAHAGDHIWSSIIGVSITLLYEKGKLILGAWQRVVLIEFNGPRERTVYIKAV